MSFGVAFAAALLYRVLSSLVSGRNKNAAHPTTCARWHTAEDRQAPQRIPALLRVENLMSHPRAYFI